MADGGIAPARACAQCGSVFQLQLRYFNKMYCGSKCKVSAWRTSNPERFAAMRAANQANAKEREAAARAERDTQPAPTKPCPTCGVSVRLKRKRCDACNRRHHSNRVAQHLKAKLLIEIERRPDRECKECGQAFRPVHGAMLFCSATCSKRNSSRSSKGKREARKRGVGSETVNAIAVFERDGWRCHICKRKTPRDLRGTYKPSAPELDHIVPLSLGGTHTYSNTACSCRKCNGRKGATVLGQPSLLALCA